MRACPKCGKEYVDGRGIASHIKTCNGNETLAGYENIVRRHTTLLQQLQEARAALIGEKERLEKAARDIDALLHETPPTQDPQV